MSQQNFDDLPFLRDLDRPVETVRIVRAGTGSVFVHLLLGTVIVALLRAPPPQLHRAANMLDLSRAMPLFAPPIPTQPEPNKGELSKEFDLSSLRERPELRALLSAPPGSVARAPLAPIIPGERKPEEVRIPEPPDLPSPIAQQLPPALGAVPQAPPPPPAPSPSKPKIAFEKPGVASGSPAASGTAPRVAAPSSKVDEAIQSVTRSGRPGAVVVGDGTDAPGGIGEGLNLPGAPGRMGSSLELLSDPAGVDFRPYLIRILSAVRRNWFAVIPESVRFGRRGRTVIQFAINRDGSVPKLVIAVPSGAEPLDRAAVAGISATNPFPPLPAEFRGSEIRLQFIFNYNMPVR